MISIKQPNFVNQLIKRGGFNFQKRCPDQSPRRPLWSVIANKKDADVFRKIPLLMSVNQEQINAVQAKPSHKKTSNDEAGVYKKIVGECSHIHRPAELESAILVWRVLLMIEKKWVPHSPDGFFVHDTHLNLGKMRTCVLLDQCCMLQGWQPQPSTTNYG